MATPILCTYLFLLSLTFPILSLSSSSSEGDILLSFKSSIEDSKKALSSWSNTSSNHHCNWTGITCSATPSLSVTSINLQSLNLSGDISSSICDLPNLSYLNLADNIFNQPIPLHLSQCSSLETLNLSTNLIWGTVPSQISQFASLIVLDLSRNHIEGNIPESLGFLKNLKVLNMGSNLISGNVPAVFRNLTKLEVLDLSQNPYLVSEIPEDIGELGNLKQLLLQSSSFQGEIPESLVGLVGLTHLDLSENNLTGEMPASLAELPVLTYLDLSDNNLTGSIPQALQNLKLALFNVSFNQLSGKVPYSLISGLPASFLEGNPGLCGPGLPNTCSDDMPRHHIGGLTTLACALISLAFVAGTAIVVGGFIWYRRSCKENQVGVWRSVLPSGELVAVKKLVNFGNQSSKSLKAEVKTLAKIRHKNVVKILGFCHSDESVFLIYEYLHGGSLGDLISRQDFQLQWRIRLRIAIGVAQGLAYLHKDYVPHLLHRNVKSSNILLDANFEPKLTDFALDRVVGEAAFQSVLNSEAASSCYIAPENGYSKKASEQLDIYSFGVVLLELVSGRQAEQTESSDSLDIVKWVRRKVNITNGVHQVLDPKISQTCRREMIGALDIALRCTSVVPEKRPSMVEVVRGLQSLESRTCIANIHEPNEEPSIPV
uniref:LRR receptor-like serine/threonine-protein kinase HSL2 n=1 Tax=Cajanus cajan TaxID=3821 RepID=A0A151TU03_CAJCA|nr:LRR receptor-like serine/threonine-protein kinase HSL2 [Cajanus cajan]